jgi:hypothetical protein
MNRPEHLNYLRWSLVRIEIFRKGPGVCLRRLVDPSVCHAKNIWRANVGVAPGTKGAFFQAKSGMIEMPMATYTVTLFACVYGCV